MSEATSSRNLTATAASGLRWTYAAALGSSVMQLVYTSATSRLLSPSAFGLMAIAQLVVRFSVYFAQMGVMQALIQKPDLSRDDVRAGSTASVAFGAIVSGAVWFAAPFAAELFGKPAVGPVLQGVGLTFLLSSVGNTAEALLRRDLRFRVVALTQVAAFFVGYLVVGIGMAVAGYGVWSLVGATLSANVVGSVVRYFYCRHAFMPLLRWANYRDLLQFGSRVSLINFGEFWGVNLDTFTVGRYEIASLVGQYNRAFYLVNLPLTYLTQSMSNVLLPSFSKLQDDRKRIARVYLHAIAMVAALMLPLCAGMAVANDELVGVVLGPGWDASAALVPILAFAAAWNILTRFAGIIFEAIAELNRKIVIQSVHLTVLVALMAVAAGRQLWMYAAALTIGEVVRHCLYVVLFRRVLAVPYRSQLRAYAPAVVVSCIVVGAMAPTRMALVALGAPLPARLVALILVGGAAMIIGLRTPPLRYVRVEVLRRLEMAGWLAADGRVRRTVDLVLGREDTL